MSIAGYAMSPWTRDGSTFGNAALMDARSGYTMTEHSPTTYQGQGRTTQLSTLKKSVPPRAWLSFFAVSMRCTMYPPPPGSLPDFHTFHHCTAIGMTNICEIREKLAGVASKTCGAPAKPL